MLSVGELTGRRESHLVATACGQQLQRAAATAFERLRRDASGAGFELAIASGFRSFDRQLAIWNGKAQGERPVHDDAGKPLDLSAMAPRQRLWAILRFSALPGASRHHWGTDVDVYDRSAVDSQYRVQLSPAEVAPGGVFSPLHHWLDERMAADESHGFFRPYGVDSGGVAVERWHLSYVPLALACARQLSAPILTECWDTCEAGLLLRDEVEAVMATIQRRYLDVGEAWCPARYRRAPWEPAEA